MGISIPQATAPKPTLAVFKFASCDGCQLTLLDCEDELLALTDHITLAYFPEATRDVLPGPWDVGLVEGSITTPHDLQRILSIREQCKTLVTIGACATAGGIQALRNGQDVQDFTRLVYAHPEYIHTLSTSTPINHHVKVDLELRGCPVDKGQLLEVLSALLMGRRPQLAEHAVCTECKLAGQICVMVAQGTPCLGPITHAGCDALCPGFHRGCFGCFGPQETVSPKGLVAQWRALGWDGGQIDRALSTFNVEAQGFSEIERGQDGTED